MSPVPEIVEIQAKSLLNRVTGMPFNWSINPYRGCSHGCVFCLAGETPILMGDGTTKPLSDLRVGDSIYGTVRRGAYRRYVRTSVLAHWIVEKPSYRITLQDGTQLVASGDHRFLTDRGWKFVVGTDRGPMRRPHLTSNNTLLGTGRLATPPLKDADYERGYLCGLVRGDGLLAFYRYEREGRAHGNQYHFRLAIADAEALDRARGYLLSRAVPTRSFLFQEASAVARELCAIATHARGHVQNIEKIVGWPIEPSPEWRKGFLAGIFDAEGGYNDGVLRITNTNPLIINVTTSCLEHLGFSFVIESHAGAQKPLRVIRLRGGLREHLRFFHSVSPAIRPKCNIEGQAIKHRASLRVVSVDSAGLRRLFDVTTGTGDFIANGVVSHNCYARRTHWFLDEDGVNQWSSKIFVKVNAPEVLQRELGRPGWKREEVAVGTATDPYQAVEGQYRLTHRILERLRDFRTPVSIVTRSPLIERDLGLLSNMAKRVRVTVCVSIATLAPDLAREIEPTVALPARRLKTVEILAGHGIRTGVLLAPILPGLTDRPEHLEAVIRAAHDCGASFVGHNVLHLGEVTKDAFLSFLARCYPELAPLYERLYPKRYAPEAYQTKIARIVAAHKRVFRFAEPRYISPPKDPEQLALL